MLARAKSFARLLVSSKAFTNRWPVRMALIAFCLGALNSHAATDPECEDDLDSGKAIYDIRTYNKRVATERLRSYTLTISTGLGSTLLTVRPLAHNKGTLYQIVGLAGIRDRDSIVILQRVVKELAQLSPDSPDQEKYLGPHLDDSDLQQHLRTAERMIKVAMVPSQLPASGLRNNNSQRVEALRALLTESLRQQGLVEEDRFFNVRLSEIHTNLLNSLTTRERAYFDYAIFSDYLGFEATERAEKAQLAWRVIDPQNKITYEEVHKGIREKLLRFGRQSQVSYRNQATSRLMVFEKVQSAYDRWLARNPAADFQRLRRMASGDVTLNDVKWLVSLGATQEPRLDAFARVDLIRLTRRTSDLEVAQANFEEARTKVTSICSDWADKKYPREVMQRIQQIAKEGMEADDIDFVLRDTMSLLKPLMSWDIHELASIRDGKPDLSNFNPMSMDIDHRVRGELVRISLSSTDQFNGPGGKVTGGSYNGGYSLGILDQPHRRRRGLDDEH